jgi:Ca-activated chloride channel homolog
MTTRRPAVLFATSLAMAATALAMASARDPDLWSSSDQRADRLFRRGDYLEASKAFSDPYRRGVALYRTGEFKDAAAAFATVATPDAAFDRGNALVMQGKYADAIASYDRALSLRTGWKIAEDNRALAVIRRDRMAFGGGYATGGQLTADQIVFGRQKEPGQGERTEVAEGDRLSDEELRGLWLRRVQTKPADFLRAKFAFQAESHAERVP